MGGIHFIYTFALSTIHTQDVTLSALTQSMCFPLSLLYGCHCHCVCDPKVARIAELLEENRGLRGQMQALAGHVERLEKHYEWGE